MLSIIGVFNYSQSTAQFKEYVNLLFYLAAQAPTSADERVAKVTQLTEAYFECRGEHADGRQLDRLATLILRDDLVDGRPDKVALTKYPILSDNQKRRRDGRELKCPLPF